MGFRNFIVQPEKMRLLEHLLYLLGKKFTEAERPLIEIACETRINTTYDKDGLQNRCVKPRSWVQTFI